MKTIKNHKFITACVLTALIIICAVLFLVTRRDEAEMQAQADSISEAIRERALQCFVIENAYPESLSYLEEHYGLTVNKRDFKIIYTPFAENLPPDIRVIYKGGGQ